MDSSRIHPETLAGDSFAAERKRVRQSRHTEAELVKAIAEDEAQQGRPMTPPEREAFARGFFGLGRLERLELQALLKAPHGCVDGLVFIGHMGVDPETGEEVEVIESVPCRRCADAVEVVEE
jgi:hypothetical protein